VRRHGHWVPGVELGWKLIGDFHVIELDEAFMY
jgi:hypothetical protein